MATVNFSVPDDVKAEFDAAFGDVNKSAIIADLMRKAVAEAARRRRRQQLFRELTARRVDRPKVTAGTLQRVRSSGRS